MTNEEKYNKVFTEALSIKDHKLEGLEYRSIEEWDSIGHMTLMAAIEEEFNIVFDTDDILDFSSYQKGKEILKKYEIEI